MNTLISTFLPVPLETLKTPQALNGEHGTNRAPAFVTQQVAATNDLQAICSWLDEFKQSPQTQRAYRKEAERLLLWSLIEKQKPFSSLTRDDLRDYQHFLENPQPHERWCGARKPRHHTHWRPFQDALSPTSIAQAITVINALFSYLVEAGYLSGNPLGLMRRKAHYAMNKETITERFLEKPLWQVVMNYIETLPKITARENKDYERIRFLFYLLYLLAPRVSEVAHAQMQDIQYLRGKWWWNITGKGQKTQRIPLNNDMLQTLTRYRNRTYALV